MKNKKHRWYSGECIEGRECSTARHCALNASEGFTLLELLISASILVLIGLAILTTFGSGLHVYERIQSYGGPQADVLLSLEEMERDLSNTFPFSGMAFQGEAQKITFPAAIEEIETLEDKEILVSSIGQTTYYLQADDDQKALTRYQRNYSQAQSGEKTDGDEGALLAYVKTLQFSYYSFDDEAGEYGWKDSWTDEQDLPVAVKIELTFEDQGRDVGLARTVFIPAVRVVEETEEGEEEEGDA